MSKQSILESFNRELFIIEIEQLIAIWDTISSPYSNKQENTYAWILLKTSFLQILFYNTASVRTSSSMSITDTVGRGRTTANSSAAGGNSCCP
jgi:hypothetical protein